MLPGKIRKCFREIVRFFGFDLHGFDPRFHAEARKRLLLRNPHLELFLDVGANTGQFAKWLRESGYRRRILSFEPGRVAFEFLAKESSHDLLWSARHVALGSAAGETELRISADSFSSSIYAPTERNLSAHVGVVQLEKEKVKIARLDELLAKEPLPESRCLGLKIDTQGSEDAVLVGASGIIPKVRLLVLELSLVRLYEGQKLLCDLLPLVRNLGFYPVIIEPCDMDYEKLEILQVDVWFLAEKA